MRTLKLAVLSLSIMPMGLEAAAPKETSFWERKTCYARGTTRICASVSLQVLEDWLGPGTGTSLVAYLEGSSTNSPFSILPSAIGFLTKGGSRFQPHAVTSPGGCDGGVPDRWINPHSGHIAIPTLGGYSLFTGTGAVDGELHWPAVNECQSGDPFAWTWKGHLPKDLLLVWRGESEDGSFDFDCWEDPKGGENCLRVGKPGKNDRLISSFSTVSTVPEPSTIALLLTGMVSLALVARRRRQKDRNAGDST